MIGSGGIRRPFDSTCSDTISIEMGFVIPGVLASQRGLSPLAGSEGCGGGPARRLRRGVPTARPRLAAAGRAREAAIRVRVKQAQTHYGELPGLL
jgi:hypothetical protein